MKKIIKLSILALLMFICMISINSSKVSAATYGDYEYDIIEEDNTVEIKRYTGTSSIVNIPSKINGHNVTKIGYNAFYNYTNLTAITIPNSVTEIGNNAFYGCIGLKEITIPNSITKIKYEVFRDCMSLKEITIPSSVTVIESDAFVGCTNLKEIKVDSNNKEYSSEQGILYNKTKTRLIRCLQSKSTVTIPSSVTVIESDAFEGCTNLTEITIPSSVTDIYYNVFDGCINLKEIKVDGNNKTYSSEQGVLYNKAKTLLVICPVTKTIIIIPSSVTEIKSDAFEGCTNLKEINVDSNNKEYSSEQGILYNKTKTELIRCPATKTIITIPSSVTKIESDAFYGCIGLKEITIPSSVTDIYYDAFSGCTNLKDIKVDSNNKTYSSEQGVLYNKSKTWLVICPEAKTTITIPDTVESLYWHQDVDVWGEDYGYDAFLSCTNLKEINVDSNNKKYSSEQGVLYNKAKTELIRCPLAKSEVTIPRSVTYIGNICYRSGNAFRGCTDLRKVTIPISVKGMIDDSHTFYNCDNLVIYVEENSYAHKFAKENRLNYKFIQNVIGQTKSVLTKAQSTKSITVAWKRDTAVSGYEIYMSTNKSKGYKRIATINKNSTTSYNKTKLKEGTTYYFKVRAYKTEGKTKKYGAYSSILTTTTRTKTPKISRVTAGKKKATVKWGKVTGATGYEIYMSTKKSSGYKKVGTNTKNNKISYTKTKLKRKKKYYFKVRTYRIVNGKKVYSSYSNVKYVKVK